MNSVTPERSSGQGVAVIRQPGSVVVRESHPRLGVLTRRVICPGGDLPPPGATVRYDLQDGQYVLTGWLP